MVEVLRLLRLEEDSTMPFMNLFIRDSFVLPDTLYCFFLLILLLNVSFLIKGSLVTSSEAFNYVGSSGKITEPDSCFCGSL